MCHLVQCDQCFRPTFKSCGQGIHVEQVLAGVPLEHRCTCSHPPMTEQQQPQQMAETVHTWSLLSGARQPPSTVVEVRPPLPAGSAPYQVVTPKETAKPTQKEAAKPDPDLPQNFETASKQRPPNPLASLFDCLLCHRHWDRNVVLLFLDKIYYH
eukprot:GGOE01055473.1.p1 GENE.GGOE01055473.1~~GGOE01055473.1.p1  ORF type:complete len:155 (+),score=5.35 GGOE01055473.1:133-597(+)